MARIDLLSGAYSSRAVIANAQRCVNLFPEKNPAETQPPAPVTHLPRAGFFTVLTPAVANWRCLYKATTGYVYGVIGNSVYFINVTGTTWSATFLGLIAAGSNNVSISDNGIIAVLVDGTGAGYWWPAVGAGTFHTISDAAFYGANRVRFLDGRFVFNRPGTNQFYLSPSFWDGTTAFDPTYIASKVGGPDPILTIAVIRGELWVIGQLTSEVWYDAGGADFPFERQPGVFIDHGIVPQGYSVAETDVEVLWLGEDRDGHCIAFRSQDYQARRISTHALEHEWNGYANPTDAVSFVFQQEGHTFWVLTFPSADTTWVYDLSTDQWHQWTWTDVFGVEHRHRAQVYCFGYGAPLIGDWENGKLYAMGPSVASDDGAQIYRRRGFPHIVKDGKRVSYSSFTADISPGLAGTGNLLYLRWSDTGGRTWGTPISIDMGGLADNNFRSAIFRRLGLARDRVFELYWSFSVADVALNGAFIEVEGAET